MRALMSRLLDAVLTTDPVQRVRLSQAGLAMLMLAAGVLAMHYFVRTGTALAAPVRWWTLGSLGGMVVFFALIRTGFSRRWRDPSLTVPQMAYAIACSAWAYWLLGAGRGAVFLIVMVILMFGMFVASPRQMRWISLYAVLVFGLAMALAHARDPLSYPAAIEWGHFIMVATMMPAVSILAGRLSRLRHRAREHRAELTRALARIRDLATRDETTGLINRRHMQELMGQEHQRCIRSGQTFCLAVFDIDNFSALCGPDDGAKAGNAALRAVALEAQRHVRLSDVLARWAGQQFVLLMSDTRAALARGGMERLRDRMGALRIVAGGSAVGVATSAGLAEHHAGETVAQTLERADRGLREAQSQGGNRVVLAS
jgi:diguanylate cyclase